MQHWRRGSTENQTLIVKKYSSIVQIQWNIKHWGSSLSLGILLLTWQMQLDIQRRCKKSILKTHYFSSGAGEYCSIMGKLTLERNTYGKLWILTPTTNSMPSSGKTTQQWRKLKKRLIRLSEHKNLKNQSNYIQNVLSMTTWTRSIIKPYYITEHVLSIA